MKTIHRRKNLLAAILLSGLILSCSGILSAQPASSPSAMPKDEKPIGPTMQKLLQATNERLAQENKALQDDSERLQRDRLNIMNEIRKTKQEKADLIQNIRMISREQQEREQSFQQEIDVLENASAEQSEYSDSLLFQIDDLEKATGEMTVLYDELAKSDAKDRRLEQMLKEAEMDRRYAVTTMLANRFQEARFHYNRGVFAYKSEKWHSAMREFRRALEKDPLDADSHYNLAVIYDVVKKDRLKAIEHYRRYLELNPKAPDAAKVKNYIADLHALNEVWGYPNYQNMDEWLWPGR
ncbi:MAG: tetratricopeptide repeat protein [Kiritimatiellia bacterium]|nr:tetratricopeptide repeat protein [Kiritimatiellia bacterium]